MGLVAPKGPIRALFPAPVQGYVPLPSLAGIEIAKLSVGTITGGSLFVAEIDAVIDQLDILSLVVSLMGPRGDDFLRLASGEIHRRIILDDVFCVLPASQGLPIPIPIFYDQIGFDYVGPGGVGARAHMSFPKPDLRAAMAFFAALRRLIDNGELPLGPDDALRAIELALKLRDEYLRAPDPGFTFKQWLKKLGRKLELG